MSDEATKEALQTPIDQLNTLADEAAQGDVSLTELKEGIADSWYGPAAAYQQQAVERLAEDNYTSGYALKASVHNLEEAYAQSGHKVEVETIVLLNDVTSLADKLMTGTEHDLGQVGQMIEKLGQENVKIRNCSGD